MPTGMCVWWTEAPTPAVVVLNGPRFFLISWPAVLRALPTGPHIWLSDMAQAAALFSVCVYMVWSVSHGAVKMMSTHLEDSDDDNEAPNGFTDMEWADEGDLLQNFPEKTVANATRGMGYMRISMTDMSNQGSVTSRTDIVRHTGWLQIAVEKKQRKPSKPTKKQAKPKKPTWKKQWFELEGEALRYFTKMPSQKNPNPTVLETFTINANTVVDRSSPKYMSITDSVQKFDVHSSKPKLISNWFSALQVRVWRTGTGACRHLAWQITMLRQLRVLPGPAWPAHRIVRAR